MTWKYNPQQATAPKWAFAEECIWNLLWTVWAKVSNMQFSMDGLQEGSPFSCWIKKAKTELFYQAHCVTREMQHPPDSECPGMPGYGL